MMSILGAIVFLAAVFIITLPSLLSTKWGNETIANYVNAKISGKITFEKLNLGWTGEQVIEGAKLFDADGKEVVSLDSGIAKTTLWNLLFSHGKHGTYKLSRLNAHIVQMNDGRTNVEQALASKENTEVEKQIGSLTISLNDVNALAVLGDEKSSTIQISGKTVQGERQGSFDINLALDNRVRSYLSTKKHFLNPEELGKIKIQAKILDFPVSLLDDILTLSDPSYKDLVLDTFGDKLNANIQTQEGYVQLAVQSKNLEGEGSFTLENDLLINKPGSPALIKFILAPEKFQSLKKRFLTKMNPESNIILDTPAEIVLNMDSFSLPMVNGISPNWYQSSVVSTLVIKKLGLRDIRTGQRILLENILGKVESPKFSQNVSFSLSGQNYDKEGPHLFSMKGRFDHAFQLTGELNIDDLALSLESKFQKFPVMLLGQFFGVDNTITKKVSVLLGDTIDAEISTEIDHMRGPVHANLSGKNGNISLDAHVNQGILTLNKNFHSQFMPTQEFGKVILEDIFPLGKGLIGSENPFTIDINAAGFVLPIKNFDMRKVKVGSATLELGKVQFRSDGQFGSVLGLLNQSRNGVIPVWFTPMYASMKNGVITIQRMDMLIMNAYPIATWGNVDLAANKVNMVVGLTGQALMKAMSIQNLDRDYMLQMPFKGPIGNVNIDKKKATAKLASLIAAKHGTEGMLIGTALNIAAGGLTEEKPPAPTTDPLPWSLEIDKTLSEIPEDDSSSSTKTKDDKHPLRQVEKKASSILHDLLPQVP